MNASTLPRDIALDRRARLSLGSSSDAIHRMVARVLDEYGVTGGHLIDVGCGSGSLWQIARRLCNRYTGLDAVQYEGFPDDGRFVRIDLDDASWHLSDETGDVVAAVETIEHLENPWAFVRRLHALAKPGALVIVTTPNQLSLLSLATLAIKQRFSAFQDVHYPAHRTALLASDLRRIASAAGLEVVGVAYSHDGRLPLTPWHYPSWVAELFPRALSDNLMLISRKPVD
jgi:2-polyprenyl-3-methyl-5-hydroxy-6-metoxy-1,4-benzoquinol methylase